MFKGKKVIVVMPAYNAEQTLKMTYDEVMAQEMVDLVILVDDASSDQTSPAPSPHRTSFSASAPRYKRA